MQLSAGATVSPIKNQFDKKSLSENRIRINDLSYVKKAEIPKALN